jgi:phospholipid transport system transporter-binding protein
MERAMKLAGPALTNDNAAQVLEQTRAAVAAGDVRVDLTDITQVDSSAVALLVALARIAKQNGRSLEIYNAPASLVSLAQLYSVEDVLTGVCERSRAAH